MAQKAKTNAKKTQKKSWLRRACESVVNAFHWVWSKICDFGKWIWKVLCMFWTWLSGLNLVALLNLALLSSVIVLFSMLIIDVVSTKSTPIVVVNPQTAATQQVKSEPVRHVKPRAVLPFKQNTASKCEHCIKKEFISAINLVPVKANPVTVKQTPCHKHQIMGDTIIANRSDAIVLKPGMQVNGNLYIQNMRKYTLPCDVKINGNLFLRDLSMLQFCGRFTVTGNIYVSPRSSFGPLPNDARIGGQIIL
ncbi:MAG: hypothetical protein MJ170_03805 [Alphaproteobacteria bacterium]|nr:hypothetical protein [Alphaproteobacteria bacterium]